MTLKVFQLAARRIPYLALALIPVLAAQPICAQSSQTAPYGYHQSPIRTSSKPGVI